MGNFQWKAKPMKYALYHALKQLKKKSKIKTQSLKGMAK